MPVSGKLGIAGLVIVGLGALTVVGCQSFVRKAMFYPTHHPADSGLTPWKRGDEVIGYAREVAQPAHVWLMLHGNGGQASHRSYAMPSFDAHDSVYVLEYPGYGQRRGKPSRSGFDNAAREAYTELRARFPGKKICLAGESLGSGPASVLSGETPAPDKIVLVVPFDTIANVGKRHAPDLLASLVLMGAWNNVEALENYSGPLEIFGAQDDEVIPVEHARALAASKPQARFHLIPGGHGWANGRDVQFRCD